MTRRKHSKIIRAAAAAVVLYCTDLTIKIRVFYTEPRISRVAISSGRACAISRKLVHSLKAKSVIPVQISSGHPVGSPPLSPSLSAAPFHFHLSAVTSLACRLPVDTWLSSPRAPREGGREGGTKIASVPSLPCCSLAPRHRCARARSESGPFRRCYYFCSSILNPNPSSSPLFSSPNNFPPNKITFLLPQSVGEEKDQRHL